VACDRVRCKERVCHFRRVVRCRSGVKSFSGVGCAKVREYATVAIPPAAVEDASPRVAAHAVPWASIGQEPSPRQRTGCCLIRCTRRARDGDPLKGRERPSGAKRPPRATESHTRAHGCGGAARLILADYYRRSLPINRTWRVIMAEIVRASVSRAAISLSREA